MTRGRMLGRPVAKAWGTAMTEIVLRVRLMGGEHLDVAYDETGEAEDKIVERVAATLAEDNGVLRCQHSGRLVVLYGRAVATLEELRAAPCCDARAGTANDVAGPRPHNGIAPVPVEWAGTGAGFSGSR